MIIPLFNLFVLFVVLLAAAPGACAENEENKKCPIMTNKSISDADSKVTYQGKDFYVCCGPCEKQFNKDKDYLVTVFKEMKTVPALADAAVSADVKLLEQRFCPFSSSRLISPSCPKVEYKGVTIYLSKPGHVRTWNENPDQCAKEAFEKGLLPQLKGKI
jgi:YHS domain-containing protein